MRGLLSAAPARCDEQVVLSYDDRLLRRKRLVTESGRGFLVDLPQVTSLDDYWGFELTDGSTVQVIAAPEDLVAVTSPTTGGPGLMRFAWHIGNRHTPCQIEDSRLLIRADHVLEAMLKGLGAELSRVTEPFRPEGGAYGHGRTMGHSHDHGGNAAHSHSHEGAAGFGWHDHGDGHLHFHPPAGGATAVSALAVSLTAAKGGSGG